VIEAVALVLGACLAVAAVLFAARPFLSEPEAVDDRRREPPEAERERVRLIEERDRALAALKELEFDHRTGKVSDEDYRVAVRELRQEAASALARLDGMMRGEMSITPDPTPVPEPWPSPGEGDLPDPAPTPAPGEPTPGPNEPAPPQHPPMPQTRGPGSI
jgi:hypothetical protein